jgi:hypothetical protein
MGFLSLPLQFEAKSSLRLAKWPQDVARASSRAYRPVHLVVSILNKFIFGLYNSISESDV